MMRREALSRRRHRQQVGKTAAELRGRLSQHIDVAENEEFANDIPRGQLNSSVPRNSRPETPEK
jgi:hypothetical protein